VLQDNWLAQDALTGLGVHSEGSEFPSMKVLKNLLALSIPNTFRLMHCDSSRMQHQNSYIETSSHFYCLPPYPAGLLAKGAGQVFCLC